MSRRRDLKLNLSGAAAAAEGSANRRMSTSSSSPSSCVSSETDQGSDSPEATSMVLAACPRCIMYVMLAEGDPRCPKCHNPVNVDFLRNQNTANNKTKSGPNK